MEGPATVKLLALPKENYSEAVSLRLYAAEVLVSSFITSHGDGCVNLGSTSLCPVASVYPEAVQVALGHAEKLDVIRQSLAILLFGSYASNAQRPGSDVDLLVITAGKPHRIYRDWPEVSVDMIIETQKSAHKKLQINDEWNNNFLMNILVSSVIIRDHDDVASSLIEEARMKWRAGPPIFSRKEAVRASRAIQKMLRSAKADGDRIADLSREGKVLCRMRLDQVVNRSFYLCFKAKRRWASSFPRSVAWIKADEPDLYRLWLEYVDSPLENRQPVAAKIVDFCRGYLATCDAPTSQLVN